MALYTPKKDNAAARLWHVLDTANSLGGGQTHAQLGKAFGLDTSDGTETVRRLLTAIDAVDEIDARIRRIPGEDHDLYLHSLPKIKRAFIAGIQNYDFNQWKSGHLSHDIIKPLLYCANLLSKYYGEDELEKAELTKLLDRVTELHQSVLQSSLNSTVKDRILESLEDIRKALKEYDIKGIHALSKALSTATGEISLHKAEFKKASEGKDGNAVNDFLKVVVSLYAMISLATKRQPLLPQNVPFPLETSGND
jgi:hypothetical protein